MYGVIVIKETGIIHGVLPNLVKITTDSVFGENSSMEGINMDVCDIYAVDTEVVVGELLQKDLKNFAAQFIFETDREKIARLEQSQREQDDLLMELMLGVM